MLVTKSNLASALTAIKRYDEYGFDTETYGLKWDDKLFSIQIATVAGAYYFNFHDYGEDDEYYKEYDNALLDRDSIGYIFDVLDRDDCTYYVHNAKFDLRKLFIEGVKLKGTVRDTEVLERLVRNDHMKYNLDPCLKRRGKAKNGEVEQWISINKAYVWETQPGKKKRNKNKQYWKVPFATMYRYGCADASDVLWLGQQQMAELKAKEIPYSLIANEAKLTKACLDMETVGIKVDLDYAKKGLAYEEHAHRLAIVELERLAGEPFVSGPNWLKRVFDKAGVRYKVNKKTGNPIFDKKALDDMDNPIANQIREVRRHEKYAGTYYSSFINMADSENIVRATIRQAGTDTGRFSYSDPNLQNIPKEDEDYEKLPSIVRSCFVPREDYCFVMMDYDQQEFRMMLDYAGEMKVIKDIMENGADVHQATADLVGITRKPAKTLNFGLLYGMGVEKLAAALKLAVAKARDLKGLYFFKMPKVKGFIRSVIATGERRKYVFNWAGRRMHISSVDFAYKLPNHLIQGGCADVVRFAMTDIADYLAGKKSRMVVQVHDEILYEIHKDELHICDDLKEIMESIYKPKNGLILSCGVDYSWKSWGTKDKIAGNPQPKEAA